MSLLDTIKGFFCKKSCEKPELKQENEVSNTKKADEKQVDPIAEIKPESVVEIKKRPPADTIQEEKIAPAAEAQETQSQIPEDSTLKRHYLANLKAEQENKIAETVAPVVEEKPALVAKPLSEIKTETIPEIKQAPSPISTKEKVSSLQIPEDATLKRHFISSLQAEIESGLPPRPTDSALKRHYDATVQAELENILAKLL